MTISERIRQFLIDKGIFPKDVDAIMEKLKAREVEMSGRWGDAVADGPEEDYPPPLMAAMFLAGRRTALEWIDANCPQAWYRPMFCADTKAELARLKAEEGAGRD